jgi:hypothetical protein
MPLLYGEEERTFTRLPEEIIKTSVDLRIFAWRFPSVSMGNAALQHPVYSGVLAQSPVGF